MALPPCERCGGRILFEEEFYCFNCGNRPTGFESDYARVVRSHGEQVAWDTGAWRQRLLRMVGHGANVLYPKHGHGYRPEGYRKDGGFGKL